MTPLQALIDARALLAEPERWTSLYMAVDQYNRGVNEHDPSAVRWTVPGAIAKVSGWIASDTVTDEWRVFNAAASAFGEAVHPGYPEPSDIAWAWDQQPRTHAEVLATFDAAIARLEEPTE